MRFSTVVAVSVAASASSAFAYPTARAAQDLSLRGLDADEAILAARAPQKKTSQSAQAATNGQKLAKTLPAEIKANIGKQGLDGSKGAADRAKTLGTSTKDIQRGYQQGVNKEIKKGSIPNASWGLQATLDRNRKLRRDFDDIVEELVARARKTKTSKSAQAAINGQKLAKQLPNEILHNIGKQGLDGTKAAADRAKTLGTSAKDIRTAYQQGINKEIKSGTVAKASWGLQATLDDNRQLRRDVEDVIDELVARAPQKKTSKSAQAATNGQKLAKSLPNEIKANIGKQGLDGSKGAADRAKTLGTSTKDIQKGYQQGINKEIKSGTVAKASWGLQATLDRNRKLRRDFGDDGLFVRDFDEELSLRDVEDILEELIARAPQKKTSKSAQAATNGQKLAKTLPAEIKANIGKQGLDGSKGAADRAKALGTSTKDIQRGYQQGINKEIKKGSIPNASWGLQATLDNNRKLRRDLENELEELVARWGDEYLD